MNSHVFVLRTSVVLVSGSGFMLLPVIFTEGLEVCTVLPRVTFLPHQLLPESLPITRSKCTSPPVFLLFLAEIHGPRFSGQGFSLGNILPAFSFQESPPKNDMKLFLQQNMYIIDFLYMSLHFNSRQGPFSPATLAPFVLLGRWTRDLTFKRTSKLILIKSVMFRNLELQRKTKRPFHPLSSSCFFSGS